MDLENELRQAMAEHVTEVSAPRDARAEARAPPSPHGAPPDGVRHRRRPVVVVAVAVIPAYQSFRPQTVGADGPGRARSTASTPPAPLPATPSPTDRAPARARRLRIPKGSHPARRSRQHPSRLARAGPRHAKALLGYLPPGIDPRRPARPEDVGARRPRPAAGPAPADGSRCASCATAGCSGPADLGLAPPMAKQSKVHGHPALRGDGPAIPSQVMWIERGGLGVWVGVSPSLGGA